MKKLHLIISCIMSMYSYSQTPFDQLFLNKTLRIDFTLSGNNEKSNAALYRTLEEAHWGGRTTQLDTSLRLGDFLLLVQDANKNTIYEEGFASLFEEWQSTAEANTMTRSFPNTCLMPFPKVNCKINIIRRQQNIFCDTLLSFNLKPGSPLLQKSSPPSYRVDTIHQKKAPNKALDIVILAEGFKADEMEEFRKLSQDLSKTLFSAKVFKDNKERINFYAIEAISTDSGTDNPPKDEWKHTPFDGSFYTLYSPRYLMAKNVWAIRDAAALVPYDQIYIIVNTPIYGGGGIYNYYAICSAYGQSSKEVLIHEFGHSFAALADEYDDNDGTLIDFVKQSKEPWQRNITTLVDFDKKWQHRLDKNTPIPTPIHKAKKYPIGAYEGAAYASKGVYRACPDCRMRSNGAKDFCPICESAIQEVIDFICGEN